MNPHLKEILSPYWMTHKRLAQNRTEPYPTLDNPVQVVENPHPLSSMKLPWDTPSERLARYAERHLYGGRNGWIVSPVMIHFRKWDKWLWEQAIRDFEADHPAHKDKTTIFVENFVEDEESSYVLIHIEDFVQNQDFTYGKTGTRFFPPSS